MKYFLLFNVGDCVQYDFELEPWEQPPNVYKIQTVGKKAYQHSIFWKGNWVLSDSSLSFRSGVKKVDCPKEAN